MIRKLTYLDSSAIVKLVLFEPETPALLSFLAAHADRTSCALARVEVLWALRRVSRNPEDRKRAMEVLERIALIRIDDAILARAAELDPPDLRSLDALHLATALSIRDELSHVVAYDDRLADAAGKFKLPVVSPA